MDFTRGETQREIDGLASRALRGDHPWKELARSGLLSLALPHWLDGDELGVADVAALLTEVGRRGAAVPALATLALGVLPIVRWADRGLQEDLLAGVGTGDRILTAALREPSDPRPARPATVATLSGETGTVSGVKIGVPYCAEAARVLIPVTVRDDRADTGADTDADTGTAGGAVRDDRADVGTDTGSAGGAVRDGTGRDGADRTAVVVVDPAAAAVTRTHTSGGEPEYTLRLDAVPVLGVLADGAFEGLYQLALAGACAVADGAVTGALALTTRHIRTREQFGRPLATFQAAAQHIADVYIEARTLHLAVTSACWRLSEGLDAGADLDVAAYWLASRAPEALRTCHHLHGGMGMDVTYPLPRLSGLVKDLVRFTGGAGYCLDRLAERS